MPSNGTLPEEMLLLKSKEVQTATTPIVATTAETTIKNDFCCKECNCASVGANPPNPEYPPNPEL